MAVSGDCGKCVKWLLFTFNLLFFLIALTVLALGIWLYVDYGPFLNDIGGQKWISAPALIITAGAFMAIVTLAGWWGAVRESKIVLAIFMALLLVTFFLYVSAGVFSALKANDVDRTLSDLLHDSLSEYGASTPVRKAWNFIQEKFECCGVNSSADWFNTSWANNVKKVPDSCCNVAITGCGLLPSGHFDRGCYVALKDAINNNVVPVGIWIVTVAVVQIIGIVFAWYLYNRIDRVEIIQRAH